MVIIMTKRRRKSKAGSFTIFMMLSLFVLGAALLLFINSGRNTDFDVFSDDSPQSIVKNSRTVPLFMQWDKRWGYIKYSGDLAGLTGCGPVCLSMAAYYLTSDANMSPDKIIAFAQKNGYALNGITEKGSSWALISEGGKQLGLDVTELPLDKNRIIRNLDAGNPIICSMGPGDFTTTGHFIVLTEYKNGKIRVKIQKKNGNMMQ